MTSNAETKSLTDLLFGKPIEPDQPAPTIDRTDLAPGAVVVWKGAHVFEYADRENPGKKKTTKLHRFASRGGAGRWFSVYASANLDSQLAKVRAGTVLLLRYAGQETRPDGSPGAHLWELRQSNATADQVRKLLDTEEWAPRVELLDAAITHAAAADEERRKQRRQNDAPPYTDDDVPPF